MLLQQGAIHADLGRIALEPQLGDVPAQNHCLHQIATSTRGGRRKRAAVQQLVAYRGRTRKVRIAQRGQDARHGPRRRQLDALARDEPLTPVRVERAADFGSHLPLELLDPPGQFGSRRRVRQQCRRRRANELGGGQLLHELRQADRRLGHHQHHRPSRSESLQRWGHGPLLPSEFFPFALGSEHRQQHDAVPLAAEVQFPALNQRGRLDEVHV